jgi:hypothetical protein
LLFQKIQVDFEGRNPTDADFHGIKQLLQQLFLKAHVNLSELADVIIGQNYVGSVVKVHNLRIDDLRENKFLLHVSLYKPTKHTRATIQVSGNFMSQAADCCSKDL